MRIFGLCIFLLISTAPTSRAQTPETTEAILAAWRTWAADNNISATSISVGHNGTILASEGQGRDPGAPYPVASLSKAITAVCLMRVVEEQGLSLGSTLGDLQPAFDKVNITLPGPLRAQTLASVITNTSGLQPDRTQSRFNRSYRYGDTRNIGFSKRAIADQGRRGDPGTFFYNNGNYALLGALLEGLTGTDNVTACAPRVFPDGHRDTAAFSTEWIALAGFGGWEVSTSDYLAFVMDAFKPGGDIASRIFGLPAYQDPNGWNYGLGTYFRSRSPQNVYWHNGALCDTTGGDHGAYFAYYATGYAVSVNYNRCGRGPVFFDLDGKLYDAAN